MGIILLMQRTVSQTSGMNTTTRLLVKVCSVLYFILVSNYFLRLYHSITNDLLLNMHIKYVLELSSRTFLGVKINRTAK